MVRICCVCPEFDVYSHLPTEYVCLCLCLCVVIEDNFLCSCSTIGIIFFTTYPSLSYYSSSCVYSYSCRTLICLCLLSLS